MPPYVRMPPPRIPLEPRKPNPRYAAMSGEELSEARRKFVFEIGSVFHSVQKENIIGIDHILQELDHCIAFLRNFEYADKHGAQLDAGVLFVGAPGSGKTFCAKYLATASEARFIDIAEFPITQDYMSAHDIAELFNLCREYVGIHNKPIVIFWDEFESFANAGESKEKIAAVSRLKQELSGIKGKARGVFIVAATNNPSVIPGDLTRPGRIGKRIVFRALRRRAKLKLLEHFIYLHNHAPNIDFDSLSYLIWADYAVDIEELINTVWLRACLSTIGTDREPILTNDHLLNIILSQARGNPDDIELTEVEMRALAIYEIGRAIVSRTLAQPTQLLAITREGYPDVYRVVKYGKRSAHNALSELRNDMAICYAGKIAQDMCEVELNGKYITDFEVATRMAQEYVERFLENNSHVCIPALASVRSDQNIPSVHGLAGTLNETTTKIEEIVQYEADRAKRILDHYGKERIESIAKDLIDRGHLLQKDIDVYLDPEFQLSVDLERKDQKLGFHKQ